MSITEQLYAEICNASLERDYERAAILYHQLTVVQDLTYRVNAPCYGCLAGNCMTHNR